MICDGTPSTSATACCRLNQLSEAQQQMYTQRERGKCKGGGVNMIIRYGKRFTARGKEGGGKIKSSRPTTLSRRKSGKMTQGLGSMMKYSC